MQPQRLDFAAVDTAVTEGRVWRAKEILQGRLGSSPYHPYLYEKYGQVLLGMGDLIEAGRYLFLSGSRHPDYEPAIRLFLTRCGRHGWPQLRSSFPLKIRTYRLQDFPTQTQQDLVQLGFQPLSSTKKRPPIPAQQSIQWLGRQMKARVYFWQAILLSGLTGVAVWVYVLFIQLAVSR